MALFPPSLAFCRAPWEVFWVLSSLLFSCLNYVPFGERDISLSGIQLTFKLEKQHWDTGLRQYSISKVLFLYGCCMSEFNQKRRSHLKTHLKHRGINISYYYTDTFSFRFFFAFIFLSYSTYSLLFNALMCLLSK